MRVMRSRVYWTYQADSKVVYTLNVYVLCIADISINHYYNSPTAFYNYKNHGRTELNWTRIKTTEQSCNCIAKTSSRTISKLKDIMS